jgi:hypothetical protein
VSTQPWRRERAAEICRRVSDAVARVAPPDLGYWDPAWALVEAPSQAFLDALATWVETGAVEDQRAVQEAGNDVVRAWKEAAQQWEIAGRPAPHTSNRREASHVA